MAERRTRIVGRMLGQFLGKEVVVLGRATKIGAGGNTVELTTLDDTKINVSMPNAIDAKPKDVLEVWGTVKSKGTMVASQCVIFDEENTVDFDATAYKELLILHHALDNRKWKLNNSRSGLH